MKTKFVQDSPAPSSPRRRALITGLGITTLCAVAAGVWRRSSFDRTTDAVSLPADKLDRKNEVQPFDGRVDAHASVEDPLSPGVTPSYTREWFLPHLKTSFSFRSANLMSPVVVMQLIHISEAVFSGAAGKKDFTSFSLIFKSTEKADVATTVAALDHAELGKMEIFISPVERHDTYFLYEAIFSHKV